MGNQSPNGQGAFDFIDSLIGLFHHSRQEQTSPPPGKETSLNRQFETALETLEETIEKESQFNWKKQLKFEDENVKKNKEHKIHEKIRKDVEATHIYLHTGISSHELDLLKEYLNKSC